MTILFTTEQFYPLQTGTAIADYNLCLALSRFGHVVYVITSSMFNFSRLTRKGPIRLISSGGLSKEAVEISPNLFVIDFFIVYEEDNWRGQLEDYQKFLISFECDLLVNIALRTWSTDYILDKFPLVKAKKKILRSHEEWSIMDNIVSWKRFIKDALKALLTLHIIHRDSHPWWQQYRFKKSLKYYDCVYFLHKGSHGYDYLKPYCTADILPNGVFEKDICSPKILSRNLLEEQKRDNNTEQQNSFECLNNSAYLFNASNYYEEKGQDFVLQAYYLSLAKFLLVFVGSLDRGYCLDYLQELKRQLDQKHGFKEVYFFYKIERSQVLALF
ncbi:group 1 glycosyl transferase [Helicobacter suis]|uniref:group 1 glycosyl transferase n=1 Tax=Helicobacter suis TaxID=104628 RepID=UPI002491A66F|nr:group 1 glycosyl transferase [Helicobacter suis]